MTAVHWLALAGFVVHWWAAGNYGFHRDELYYIAGGLRWELGYVDHPPLVPWLAAATTEVFGLSLRAVRIWAALGSAISILLAGRIALLLGGNRRASNLAALATLLCPFYYFSHTATQTNLLDQLAWLAALYVLTCALVRGTNGAQSISVRSWLVIGSILLIGALAKYTIAVLGLSLAAALAICRRAELRRPGLYLAGALALLGAAPSLWWQAQHGWPFREFSARMEYNPPWIFVAMLVGMMGPGSLPLAAVGIRDLLRRRDVRVLGWIVVLALGTFLVLGAKPYYPNTLFVLVFAAGAVILQKTRRRWPEWLLLLNLAVLPVLMPVLPLAQFAKIPDPIGELSEMVGWPDLVQQLRAAYENLPTDQRRDLVILTGNYGEAAALELLWDDGSARRPPILSGHNSYAFWADDALASAGLTSIERALVVGYSEEGARRRFSRVRPIGRVSNPWGIDNEEAGYTIFYAEDLRGSTEDFLLTLPHFN